MSRTILSSIATAARPAALVLSALVCLAGSQPAFPQESDRTARSDPPRAGSRTRDPAGQPAAQHPLEPALRIAESCRQSLADVEDYEAMFSKWEIVGGRGHGHTMRMKFRTTPMSVYLRFENPHAGREVIYVEGRNDGNLLAHETGVKSLVGTVALRPDSPRALSESKHPITHAGLANMLEGILAQWRAETKLDGVEVLYYADAKLRGAECKVIEATHPRPGRDVRFHRTRLYIDKQTNLPVRLEQFGFPERPGEKPPLLEQYTYWNIRTNVGLTDADFDVRNPAYGF
ncbi:MAG TPA: DUF1571 domain-containing protein [Planctomycetaceae bacterium]|nr:DUF1571 domain-containing protein [Planctomycetaceae bacterium]